MWCRRVEYFGVKLEGFCFTEAGWVQSYGSRYVRPPIIYGDVSRPAPMTVKEYKYAQSLTKKPVKGMLTGELPNLTERSSLSSRLPSICSSLATQHAVAADEYFDVKVSVNTRMKAALVI